MTIAQIVLLVETHADCVAAAAEIVGSRDRNGDGMLLSAITQVGGEIKPPRAR